MRGTQGVQLGRRASVFISAAQVKSFKFKIVSLQRAWRGYVAKCEAQRMLVGPLLAHDARATAGAQRTAQGVTDAHPPAHA
jgi:hypothetical protein